MSDKILMEQIERGKADALALRNAAPTMTDAELIASIGSIPKFNPTKDYSAWPVGAPVKEMVNGEYCVFRLLFPHNANDYSGTPADLSGLWKACNMVIPTEPTTAERIANLEAANAALEDALCDMDAVIEEMRSGGETA